MSDPTGRPGRRRSDADWAEIRAAYEAEKPVAEILAEFGVARGSLYRRIAREGWQRRMRIGERTPTRPRLPRKRPGDPASQAELIARMFKVVDRQIAEIEKRLSPADFDEKDARTLAGIARTLELLIGLKKQAGPQTADTEIDIDAFREDLARRIAGLRDAG